MSGINRVTVVGHLGKDPVHRQTSNSNVVQFSIAVTESYTKGNEKVERTEWVPVKCWGSDKFADFLMSSLKKGSKVLVEGKFQTEKFQKDGRDTWSSAVVVQSFGGTVIPMGSSSGTGGAHRDRQSEDGYRSSSTQQRQAPAPADDFDDEIPF